MSEGPRLEAAQLNQLFPFHLLVGADMRVRGLGTSLSRVCPDLAPGAALLDHVSFRRPFERPSFEALMGATRSVFVFEHSSGLVLKGQALPNAADEVLFACSPWITELAALATLGLTMQDFAVHDPITDYLFLLQAKDTSLRELDALTGELRAQREQLRAAEEAQRRARSEAEAASKAKSEFLAMVSHEIRTPMNAILGMTALARDSADSSERGRFLDRVLVNADSLLHLLNDMLDLSKVEAGQIEVEERPFSPRDVVRAVASALATTAAQKHIEFVIDIEPSVPRMLIGDPHRLRQIVLNLVGNAVKFTRAGFVAVSVTYPREELPTQGAGAAADPHHLLVVEVQDTGVGIAADDIERVFGKFAQARVQRDAALGGTGLGLAISRSLAQLMGGDVRAESTLGVGSTFRFAAPLAATEAAAPPMASHSGRVLVVSENRVLRASWRRGLENAGYSVLEAAGATHAGSTLGPGTDIAAVCLATEEPALKALADVVYAAQRGGARAPGLVLLHPADRAGIARQSGARAVRIARPVLPSDLVESVQTVRASAARPPPAIVQATWPGVRVPMSLRLHILVAEDHPDSREILVHHLETRGHTVVSVGDGAAAVDEVRQGVFDLVLMDLDMPVMSGHEALVALREVERSMGRTSVPVVAVSAHALSETRAACLAAGMAEFVAKPAPPTEILGAGLRFADRRPVVLLADDNVDNRVLYSTFLSRSGKVRPWSVARGDLVIDACASRTVQLVLLDMEMPGLSGYEVAAGLAKVRDSPPAIAVTGHDGPAARRATHAAGCILHLAKPVRRRDLLRAVAEGLATGTEP
ncbi:MAG: response regulator [Deltaproteobacteria bacterium]|nr:response regulator [Deltaproteobacteria bacterium]